MECSIRQPEPLVRQPAFVKGFIFKGTSILPRPAIFVDVIYNNGTKKEEKVFLIGNTSIEENLNIGDSCKMFHAIFPDGREEWRIVKCEPVA